MRAASTGFARTAKGNVDVGVLIYGDTGMRVHFDDRVLAHLQLVIASKLSRSQSFFLSWRDSRASGDGQSGIWISRGMPLYFSYKSSARVEINREWIRELALSADQAGGMFVTAEPDGDGNVPRPESTVRST